LQRSDETTHACANNDNPPRSHLEALH